MVLVVSSGIHGNETAPIEIVDELVRGLLRGDICLGIPVLFIIGNPPAMNAGKRFLMENLNRLFGGRHEGKTHPEAERAKRLEHWVRTFYEQYPTMTRRHYDLHTAIRPSRHEKFAIYPYRDGKPWERREVEHLYEAGIDTVLLGHQPSGTFSYFTSHAFEAHAFTVELGKVMPFGENDLNNFLGIRNKLKTWLTGRGDVPAGVALDQLRLYQVKAELIRKSEEHFRFHVDDDVANFTEFTAGYRIMDDLDGGYVVEEDGEAIVFPNPGVPVGQRVGLMVVRAHHVLA
jgi:succinylglutamate desuccinylase